MELPRGAKITHSGLLQHNADGTTEIQKITQAGLVARSPEGTAAKGMNIRGNEDLWVEIQANTFRNWVNEHLRDVELQVSVLLLRKSVFNKWRKLILFKLFFSSYLFFIFGSLVREITNLISFDFFHAVLHSFGVKKLTNFGSVTKKNSKVHRSRKNRIH